MLDSVGEYSCDIATDGHWVLEEVSERNAMPSLQGYPPHVPLGVAEQTLLHAERPVHSVLLNSDAATADVIPAFLARLPELRSLTLPSQIAPSLRPERIGPYVKELKFHGHYHASYWDNKTVALPSNTLFPGIESLSGSALAYRVESRFRFDPALFPALKSIGFTFDPKRRFAQTLRGLPHLRIVNAAAFDSIDSLADMLPHEELVSLTLSWNRKIETLAGIERFPNLRYLKLGSLTQLRSLDAIQALQHLEFVGVYWSRRIDQAEALLKLPTVQRIKTFGIDPEQPTWHRVRHGFAARNIDVILMG